MEDLFLFLTSLSLNWLKRAQSCISCIEDDRKIKVNIWLGVFLWEQFLKILQFCFQWWRHGSKRRQTIISYTNDCRKIKVSSKGKFEVNFSFMKPFSQTFEVLTPPGDFISPKLAWKIVQTRISCTNGDRKMKIKSIMNF